MAATHSIKSSCGQQFSIEFNRRWNLLREQGVVGSNPIAPTIIFKTWSGPCCIQLSTCLQGRFSTARTRMNAGIRLSVAMSSIYKIIYTSAFIDEV
jgi:hypothetical protein